MFKPPLQDQLDPSFLLNEQMKSSIGNYFFDGIAIFSASLLLYFILLQYGEINFNVLTGWLVIQTLLSCVLIGLYWQYHQNYHHIKDIWVTHIEIPHTLKLGAQLGLIY